MRRHQRGIFVSSFPCTRTNEGRSGDFLPLWLIVAFAGRKKRDKRRREMRKRRLFFFWPQQAMTKNKKLFLTTYTQIFPQFGLLTANVCAVPPLGRITTKKPISSTKKEGGKEVWKVATKSFLLSSSSSLDGVGCFFRKKRSTFASGRKKESRANNFLFWLSVRHLAPIRNRRLCVRTVCCYFSCSLFGPVFLF